MPHASSSVQESIAVARGVRNVVSRIDKLAERHRPRTRDSLGAYVKAATRDGAKLYAVDPRDAVRYAEKEGLIKPELARDVLDLLQDVEPPESASPVPPEAWPAMPRYEWSRPPAQANASVLARWFCARSYWRVRIPQVAALSLLFDMGWVEADSEGRLRYQHVDESAYSQVCTTANQWKMPWTIVLQPTLEGALTHDAVMRIDLEQDSGTGERVAEVRNLNHWPHEEFVPHLDLFCPFVRAGRLVLQPIQRKLHALACEPFNVQMDSMSVERHRFPWAHSVFVQPDEPSMDALKTFRDCIQKALPQAPQQQWSLKEQGSRKRARPSQPEEAGNKDGQDASFEPRLLVSSWAEPPVKLPSDRWYNPFTRWFRDEQHRREQHRREQEEQAQHARDAFKRTTREKLFGRGPLRFRVTSVSVHERPRGKRGRDFDKTLTIPLKRLRSEES